VIYCGGFKAKLGYEKMYGNWGCGAPPPPPLLTSIGYRHPSKTPYKVAEAQGLKAAVYHMSLGIRPSGLYRWNLSNWVERGTVRVKCLAQEHNTMHMTPARV